MLTTLTLNDVKNRQQTLRQEMLQDQAAVKMGVLDSSEAKQRAVHREFEQRWLEMESLLLDPNPVSVR